MQAADDVGPVLAGSEDQQITVGCQRDVGELPFDEVFRVVRKRPAGQIHIVCGGVENFDPIRAVAVFVVDSVLIVGHELGYDHARQRRIGVEFVGPIATGEIVRTAGQIMNAVIGSPHHLNCSRGGLRKLKNILPRRKGGNARGGTAVDQQIGSVHVPYAFAEIHLEARQIANCRARRWDQIGNSRRRGVGRVRQRHVDHKVAAAAERGVERLHRDDIRAGNQVSAGIAQRVILRRDRLRQRGRRRAVERNIARRHVEARDFRPVYPGDEPVVAERVQPEFADVGGVRYHKSFTQENAGVTAKHVVQQCIARVLRGAAGLVLVVKCALTRGPGGVEVSGPPCGRVRRRRFG